MSHLNPIYAVWDNNAEAMALAIGEPGVKVRQWRNRGNIPPAYWQRIIDEAAARGVTLTWNQFTRPLQQVLIGAARDVRADQHDVRTITCSVCDLRLDERTVRGCQALDCPQAERDAA